MQMMYDPYMKSKRSRIAAVDFDGTLKNHKDDPVEGSKRGMRWLHENGYRIVIWTCSAWSDDQILKWLDKHGYPEPAGINVDLTTWNHPPKIVCDLYIDDRGVNWDGWSKAIKWLERAQ